ncbi:PREDICTED: putative amidase C869.01 [Theobroma cacao]|uniref:Amidase C869.01 n=1 Tax=Theobroma cacao TaxID=3641 RepID=A0AB32VW90_THECC|nr:PREDICTED: putative amidase C869.01 [Theobroma cacao]
MAANSSLRSSSVLFLIILILSPISSSGFSTSTTTHYSFSIKEATIKDIKLAVQRNELTSRQLVEFYLGEIVRLNVLLKGIIEVNPDALYQADTADKERKYYNGLLPDLHGIPILLKDNIGTNDKLNTTAGSFALLGSVVPRDAGVVMKLRKAGAIILGKASLSEWSMFRSLTAPAGFSPRGGQVVGLKPTAGLTSRAGVIPITPRQDTIGPICRTVSDAVYVLDAIVGFDSNDHATRYASAYIPPGGYKQFLNSYGLKGKRLGIVRNPFFKIVEGLGFGQTFETHLQTLRGEGAVLVDNLQIANIDVILNFNLSGEALATLAEFKLSLNAYLQELVASPVRSLADIIAFNLKFPNLELTDKIGQDIFLAAQATNGIGAQERAALSNLENLSRNGFEKLMKDYKLDALATPRSDASPMYAIGGFPAIIVPAGYDSQGVPIGLSFGGLKGSEPKLIEIAYGFEQATKIRKPPSFKP